ncbi:MAG: hypothetical protein ACE5ES_00870 [Candidatus Nanoarchaeia archaeon]
MTVEIADCCAVCDYTPHINKKKPTQYCHTKKRYVLEIMICELYQRNESRVRRRLGGFRSGLRQKRQKGELD